jgi:hypothetical protein
MTQGARVPGTSLELEPSMAAFNLGAMMDGAALAAILPVADFLARRAHNAATAPPLMQDVLAAMNAARQMRHMDCAIAGVLHLLGASREQLSAALHLDRAAPPDAPASRRACAEAAASAVRISFQVMPGAPHAFLRKPAQSAPALTPGRARHDDFAASVAALFPIRQAALIRTRIADGAKVAATPVHEFIALLVCNG